MSGGNDLLRRLFWAALAIALAVYLVMIFWSLPRISEAAGGMTPFDLRPFGYDMGAARGFLAALGPEGTEFYREVQLTIDTLFPAALALSLGLGFQPQLTGRDNARLTALLQGASKAEADGHLEEVKAFSELGDSFEEPVKTYSAGMRARLGFSAALLINVEVLLIDEVLSVGDRYFRKKATAAMRERIGGRQTAVLVSHSTALLRNLCTRAICLDNGAISFDGDIEAAVDNYLR